MIPFLLDRSGSVSSPPASGQRCASRGSAPGTAWGAAAVLIVCVLASSGCRRTLLGPDEDRSQFSRYDLVREQDVPAYLQDEFGRRQPNLRGRLIDTD
ncbi:MAG: hypothetical protein AAF235_06850 [Planctomycetota bacterium]